MSKTPSFRPTKCCVFVNGDGLLVTDRMTMGPMTFGKGTFRNAVVLPLPPRGYEWVLKPTAGKGRGKNPKEPKRG